MGLQDGQMNGQFNKGLEMRARVYIASVSCERPDLLNRTLSAVIGHPSNFEKKLFTTVLADC
eukprot:Ihof_evm6s509 gene=Ihof_evmTU6s509